jgi:hypothetical protein
MAELRAKYRDPDLARRAIQRLERNGIDADRIHLIEAPGAHVPKIDEAMREPDMTVTGKVGRRGFLTAVCVAIIAAAIGAGIAMAITGSPRAGLIAAAGCFAAGGGLGFFYGGASALAVSEEWGDTYETAGPATLSVEVDDDRVIDLRETLAATDPIELTVS